MHRARARLPLTRRAKRWPRSCVNQPIIPPPPTPVPQEFALRDAQGASPAALDTAREALAVLSLKFEAPVAWGLLVDLGAAERHAPLALLRAGVPTAFETGVEAAAQVGAGLCGDANVLTTYLKLSVFVSFCA